MYYLIYSFGDSKLFTTVDENPGDWKISVVSKDPEKKSFTTHMGILRKERINYD